jgi:hypothetical protein
MGIKLNGNSLDAKSDNWGVFRKTIWWCLLESWVGKSLFEVMTEACWEVSRDCRIEKTGKWWDTIMNCCQWLQTDHQLHKSLQATVSNFPQLFTPSGSLSKTKFSKFSDIKYLLVFPQLQILTKNNFKLDLLEHTRIWCSTFCQTALRDLGTTLIRALWVPFQSDILRK